MRRQAYWSRATYVMLALGTITLGLGVHLHGEALGPIWQDVVGDAIWAAMIAWWVASLVPAASVRDRVVAAVAICFAVEFSQLYHTPALDALRRTTAGELTLGSGFDPRDLAAYTMGVLGAALFERTLQRWIRHTSQRGAI